jgi:hypothetical protein
LRLDLSSINSSFLLGVAALASTTASADSHVPSPSIRVKFWTAWKTSQQVAVELLFDLQRVCSTRIHSPPIDGMQPAEVEVRFVKHQLILLAWCGCVGKYDGILDGLENQPASGGRIAL